MKRQIRRGVFETNSSSVHSITMCTGEQYDKWKNEEILYWKEEDKFGTREEIIEEMKNAKWWDGSFKFSDVNWEDEDEVADIFSDYEVKTHEEYFDDEWFETYVETYTTPKGEEIVAFGYYGHD